MALNQSDAQDSECVTHFHRKLKIQLLCISSKKELDLDIETVIAHFAGSIFIKSAF